MEVSRRGFLGFLAPLAVLPVVGPSMLLSERPKSVGWTSALERYRLDFNEFHILKRYRYINDGKESRLEEVWRHPDYEAIVAEHSQREVIKKGWIPLGHVTGNVA